MARLQMQELRRVPISLIMGPYASRMPQYALISLSIPDHGLILLNVPKYT